MARGRTREAEPERSRCELELELGEGERHDLLLALGGPEEALDVPPPDAAWSSTEELWRTRVPPLEHAAGRRDAPSRVCHPHRPHELRGRHGCSRDDIPARARAHEGRNYDYRYVWVRDQCLAGEAAAVAGPLPVLDDAVRFVTERLLSDGPALRPAYTVSGGRVPPERALGLPGYPGGSDIVGNNAGGQFQLDGFGQALLLFSRAAEHDRLDGDAHRAALVAAEAIAARWRERDWGIWETNPDHWTHSRMLCAAGLRAFGVRCGGKLEPRLRGLADEITADTAAHAVHPSGRWQRSPSDDRVDASLLLIALRGAVGADDPRSIETARAVLSELTEDGYAYRYRLDSRPLGEAEGAFLLCGFILSLALASRATMSAPCAGSSVTAPRAGPQAFSPRNSTSHSASFEATSHRRSSTIVARVRGDASTVTRAPEPALLGETWVLRRKH